MNQITVRGLDEELSACLHRLAKREGLSLNQAALMLMRRGADLAEGPGRPRRRQHRLRKHAFH